MSTLVQFRRAYQWSTQRRPPSAFSSPTKHFVTTCRSCFLCLGDAGEWLVVAWFVSRRRRIMCHRRRHRCYTPHQLVVEILSQSIDHVDSSSALFFFVCVLCVRVVFLVGLCLYYSSGTGFLTLPSRSASRPRSPDSAVLSSTPVEPPGSPKPS